MSCSDFQLGLDLNPASSTLATVSFGAACQTTSGPAVAAEFKPLASEGDTTAVYPSPFLSF
jgi:hypothetical protein